MKFRPLGNYQDTPTNQKINDPHIGVTFNYSYMGNTTGEMCELYVETVVYDHFENAFFRRSQHVLKRNLAKECIAFRVREHLLDVGVDRVQANGLLREFEVDKNRCLPFDPDAFKRRRD